MFIVHSMNFTAHIFNVNIMVDYNVHVHKRNERHPIPGNTCEYMCFVQFTKFVLYEFKNNVSYVNKRNEQLMKKFNTFHDSE